MAAASAKVVKKTLRWMVNRSMGSGFVAGDRVKLRPPGYRLRDQAPPRYRGAAHPADEGFAATNGLEERPAVDWAAPPDRAGNPRKWRQPCLPASYAEPHRQPSCPCNPHKLAVAARDRPEALAGIAVVAPDPAPAWPPRTSSGLTEGSSCWLSLAHLLLKSALSLDPSPAGGGVKGYGSKNRESVLSTYGAIRLMSLITSE